MEWHYRPGFVTAAFRKPTRYSTLRIQCVFNSCINCYLNLISIHDGRAVAPHFFILASSRLNRYYRLVSNSATPDFQQHRGDGKGHRTQNQTGRAKQN